MSRNWRTRRHVAAAHERAAALGQLVPVEPARRRVDGFPELGRGQVYAFRTGTTFHTTDCEHVAFAFDEDPDRVLVIDETTVGGRRRCSQCADLTV